MCVWGGMMLTCTSSMSSKTDVGHFLCKKRRESLNVLLTGNESEISCDLEL